MDLVVVVVGLVVALAEEDLEEEVPAEEVLVGV